MNKEYLGDGVYIESDGNGFVLTTEDGLPDAPTNTIYLEPEVVWSLQRYLHAQK
jgi:agmatine/peptidylarginine deiminase